MGARQEYTESLPLIRATSDRRKKLVVQEFLKSYLFYRIKSAANIVKCYETLEVPFYLTPPVMGKWIGRGDTLPDASTSAPVMGFATNRYFIVPAGFDMLEQMEIQNDPSKVFDMANLRAMEQSWAMARGLSSAIWNGTGGKMPDGLSVMIEKLAPASQVQVFMGVNKATKPWARNKYIQMTSDFGSIAAGTSLPAGFISALSLIDQCTISTLIPSDLVTTRACFQLFRRAMLEVSSAQHLLQKEQVANMGFQNFMFDGLELGWDANCPADSLYALHLEPVYDSNRSGTKADKTRLDSDLETLASSSLLDLNGSIALIIHPDIQNKTIEARRPYRQLEETSWVLTSANLAYMRMADQGVAGSDNGSRWETWG